MFRTYLSLYFKRGSFRSLTVGHPNLVTSLTPLRCIENHEHDLGERRYSRNVRENRVSLGTNEQSQKSVLFEVQGEALNPLNSCTSVEEVLIYLRNNPKIDFQLYAPVFNAIFKLYKSGSTKLSSEDICRCEEIETLSKNVKNKVRFLKVEDAVSILKVLTYFGISTNSLLCQSLLQMISKQVNRLGITQISFLYFILSKSTSSPLADGLKIAIPIVFETHVRSQLDEDDTSTVALAVGFAFEQESVTNETRNMLVDTALRKIDAFTLSEDYAMIKRLSFVRDGPENVQILFKKLMLVLTENIDHLKSNQIIKLVSISIDKYMDVHESFFDENLVKTSIHHFISNKINLEDTGKLLRQLVRVSYYCPELLEYMDDQFKLSFYAANLSNITNVISFITACSNCTYHPKNWNLYENNILNFLETVRGVSFIERKHWKIMNNSRVPLNRVVIDLMVLKCWPKTLVEFCFQKDFHKKSSVRGNATKLDYISLLSMYHIVKLLYSDYYAGPYPPTHILNRAVSILSEPKEYHLLGALQEGLGGPQYVLNGVKTKFGQIIDYLIVKCKSGQIYPLNPTEVTGNCNLSYESLNIPGDSFSIAIVLLSPVSYCLDGFRLRGKMEINLQCLEAYGITTIPVSYYQWLELQDCEKIPYLMDKINRSVPVSSSFKRLNNKS